MIEVNNPQKPIFTTQSNTIEVKGSDHALKKRKIRPRVLKEDHDRTVSFLSKAAIVMTIISAIGWVGFIYLLAKLI